MSQLTIGEMIKQVPDGETRRFERLIADSGEERYFLVWQNWDYRPGRVEWVNGRSGLDAPWYGTRGTPRIPVGTLPPPDVRFKGLVKQVVDFYSTGSHAHFISDKLFRLIEQMDPGSLEHVEFELCARDGQLPFHAVMPTRSLEAIDPRRTTVLVRDEPRTGRFWQIVKFPEGIVFNNQILEGVASFTDVDAHGWYWSKDLIEQAKSHEVRGLYAVSVSSIPNQEIERL